MMKDKKDTVNIRKEGESELSRCRQMGNEKDSSSNELRRPDPPVENSPQMILRTDETSGTLMGQISNPPATRTCNLASKENASSMAKNLELKIQISTSPSFNNENTQSSLADSSVESYHSLVGDERDRLLPTRIDDILNGEMKSSCHDGIEMEIFRGTRNRSHGGYHRWPSPPGCHCDAGGLSHHSEEGFDILSEDFIGQSLKDQQDECQKIQNENGESHLEDPLAECNSHSPASASYLNGSLNLSLSISLPKNQMRNRIGSADADAEYRKGVLSSSNFDVSPMRARSFTSPPEIILSSVDNNSSRQNFQEFGQTSYRSQSTNADTNSTSRRSSSSLLSSLDSGMNTLRRWMNSQTYVLGHAPDAAMIPRQSNAVLDVSLDGEREEQIMTDPENSVHQMPDRIHSRSYNGSRSTALDNIWESINDGTATSVSTGTNNSADEVGGGGAYSATSMSYPQTIEEEEESSATRQRAFSEPERPNRLWMAFSRRRRNRGSERNRDGNRDISRLRHVHNAHDVFNPGTFYEERSHSDATVNLVDATASSSMQSTPPFINSLHQERSSNSLPFELISDIDHSSHSRLDRVPPRLEDEDDLGNVREHAITMQSPPQDSQSSRSQVHQQHNADPNREARRTWIVINQRFQLFAVLVGITFSLLRFSIMITWVVLTSAYVVSIDEECDLPLKLYFWFATFQLILDVFRKDIMRYIFRFDASRVDHHNVPSRVIFYNLAYITYAMLVLRLGIRVIFLSEGGCRHTATKLFNTTRVYVIMSVCAWMLILFGYFIPFCAVAIVLTRNGYSPAVDGDAHSADTHNRFGVFPGVNSAPPGCIDRLKVLKLDDFLSEYPRECCICMTDFTTSDIIVATECEHVFHRRCCQEWLKQARTCPVCRSDIPSSLGVEDEEALEETVLDHRGGSIFTTGPFRSQDLQRELLNLVSMFTRDPTRIR
uniref:RING-type domain-containing protein n=1 Tax=Chaetoceros debilis TaxID=122233 RepID=A0A7S3Q2V0_9STRA